MKKSEHEKEEERIRKTLHRRFIEDVIAGEVRVWEKIDGVWNVRFMNIDEVKKYED